MGTSLSVYPFAGLVNEVNEETPRLLLNNKPVGVWKRYLDDINYAKFNYRDVSDIDECDKSILKLAQLLGWEKDLKELCSETVNV